MDQEPAAAPWSDDPRLSAADDELDRAKFAEMVAGRISALPTGASSVVFGLVGPWGSGKSTVVNMVLEKLPSTWERATFAPWAASSAGGLLVEFFRTVDTVLGGKDGKASAAKKAIREYGGWGTSLLGLIPGVGGVLATFTSRGLDKLLEPGPWDRKFKKAADELKKLGTRVLIVCDDIDRLDANELLDFLKVVRLLGRFPNIHYLVVYDQSTVEDLLRSQRVAGRLSNFMEKIVQHPFELPPIAEAKKLQLATETLASLFELSERRIDDDDEARATALTRILARILSTPRAQYRYRHQLESYAGMLDFEELDILDFAALTVLRLHYHPVYEALPEWAHELRAGLGRQDAHNDPLGLQISDLRKRVTKMCGDARAGGALDLIDFLFPGSFSGALASLHAKALAAEQYFDRFYYLGVPPDDVADAVVEEAIDAITGRSADARRAARIVEFAAVLDSSDAQRARLGYTKALQYRSAASRGSWGLVVFLQARQLRRTEESGGFETPIGTLIPWLTLEVQLAYRDQLATREQLLDLFGERFILTVLLRARTRAARRVDFSQDDIQQLLTDFARYFRAELDPFSNSTAGLGDLETLRLRLSLIAVALGVDSVHGLLDHYVERDPPTIATIASSLVEIQRWQGADGEHPELAFAEQLWAIATSEEVRQAHWHLLPEETVDDVDEEDISIENIRRFGVAWARSIESNRAIELFEEASTSPELDLLDQYPDSDPNFESKEPE